MPQTNSYLHALQQGQVPVRLSALSPREAAAIAKHRRSLARVHGEGGGRKLAPRSPTMRGSGAP